MTEQRSIATLRAQFGSPPNDYRPIPFWWWTGERLELSRLEWELDRLCEQGVSSAIISYNHQPDGQPDVGDPPVFSDAWWDLLRGLLDACEARGMTLGFQDYCLLSPRLAQLAARHPALKGHELRHVAIAASPSTPAAFRLPDAAEVVEVMAYRSTAGVLERLDAIDLTGQVIGQRLEWIPVAGEWTVIVCLAQPNGYDPLHPDSGRVALESFYGEYERRLPGALGRTLKVSFQDELDFGGRFPLWSAGLSKSFIESKGYPPAGRWAELFIWLDDLSAKFRLDFHDVSMTLAERGWFEPLYRWHEARGMLFGHDNAGRGGIAVGAAYYGDTLRAMRWYSAPGSDDPKLSGPRAFKGIKVASSLAHLYARPRVWAECFHSSGWGVAPSAVRDGLNALFALGATVVNLHGLYYSTRGGWWEWAPPDFHFRQPYWAHMGALNAYATRLSWLLAQGKHACDVAIFYPSEAVAIGINPKASPDLVAARSLSEAQRNEADYSEDLAEALTFAGAAALFDAGLDFDFIDSDSLRRGRSNAGELQVAEARYRAIVLPQATAMPWAALQSVLAFSRAGGRVLIVGDEPRMSDRAGANDPELLAAVAEISSRAVRVPRLGVDFAERVLPLNERRIGLTGGRAHLLWRRLGDVEVVYVHNPTDQPVALTLRLPSGSSRVERWHAETGLAEPVPISGDSAAPSLSAHIASRGAHLYLCSPGTARIAADGPEPAWTMFRTLPDREWEFSLAPTMDDRFGDFSLHPAPQLIGAHAGRMWSSEDPATDDWREISPGVAPRLRLIGPFPPTADRVDLDRRILAEDPMCPRPIDHAGIPFEWRDYEFSTETGLVDDPFMKSWDSGPHGLKGYVPEEFIDLNGDRPGEIFYLIGYLWAPTAVDIDLTASSRAAHRIWFDGQSIIDQPEAMPPGLRSQWNLPHYEAVPRTHRVTVGPAGNRVVVRLIQPLGQRIRAYVAPAAPAPGVPRLRWFHGADRSQFRVTVQPESGTAWFKWTTPPGLEAVTLVHRGAARAWLGDIEGRREILSGSGDRVQSRFRFNPPAARSAGLRIAIDTSDRGNAADLILEPIEYHCGSGVIDLGDWTKFGLEAYSGMATYRIAFELDAQAVALPLALEIGDVAVTCAVRLNGVSLGMLIGPPLRLPLGDAGIVGRNILEITVANTLANFYAFNRPTPYADRSDVRSGLFGPILLLIRR